MSGLTKNPLAGLAALGLAGMAPSNTGGLNPTGKLLEILEFFIIIAVYNTASIFFNCLFFAIVWFKTGRKHLEKCLL